MKLDCRMYMCQWCKSIVSARVYHDCAESKAAAKARLESIAIKWGGTFALLALHDVSGGWDANGSPV